MHLLKSIAWVLVLYVLTIGTMVGAAYLWVWIYSVTINTAGDQQFYEAYAQLASPVVAVITAFPVFYGMGVFLRRFENAQQLAISVVIMHWLVEVAVLMSIDNPVWIAPYAFASAVLKAVGAWLALRGRVKPASAES